MGSSSGRFEFARVLVIGSRLYTVEALVSDPSGIEKSGRNKSWSLTRLQSRKRPIAETIESGHLPELLT